MRSGEEALGVAVPRADANAAVPTITIAKRSPVAGGTSASRPIETADDVLDLFEARRARSYAAGMAAMCVFAVGLVLWIGGDPLGQAIHAIALAATGLIGAFYLYLTRDLARYRVWHVQALAITGVLSNVTGFVYWGPLSAYLAVGSASAYAFASGTGVRAMLWPCVISLVAYIGVSLAHVEGLIPIASFVLPAPALDMTKQVVLICALQLIFAAATVGGMDAYRIMRDVITQHQAALRALSQRDAQLAEAHEAVRQARGPGEGRYTGTQLGRYQLREVLGRGAMGEIYAAVDDNGRPCALKVLAAHLLGNEDAVRRFQREARVISGLSVPNIVRMLEVSAASAPVPYIAMERLDGKDLGALIKEQPVRALPEVVTILRGVADGLVAAHELGVVHRDLKPSNVFAASMPGGGVVWKILDFGVSKLQDAEATLTGAHLVGTPGYMAPEQARGLDVDRRADVYALGVLAYRLLTGRPAVVPGNVSAMINEVINKMPPRPSGVVVLGGDVEAVLAVALAKSPDDRFATADELASALAAAAAGALSPALRERGAELVRRNPWGAWIRAGRGHATVPIADKPRMPA